jgi:hypothetical protein
MVRHLVLGCIASFLLVLLAGVCIAEETPSSVLYMQGGENSVSNGTDGMVSITVKDIVPYFNIISGNTNNLIPVKTLANISEPMDAVLIFAGPDNKNVYLVQVSSMSLSDDETLTLEVTPKKYYEGEALKSYATIDQTGDILNEKGMPNIGIYMEYIPAQQSNKRDDPDDYDGCYCHMYPVACTGYCY